MCRTVCPRLLMPLNSRVCFLPSFLLLALTISNCVDASAPSVFPHFPVPSFSDLLLPTSFRQTVGSLGLLGTCVQCGI